MLCRAACASFSVGSSCHAPRPAHIPFNCSCKQARGRRRRRSGDGPGDRDGLPKCARKHPVLHLELHYGQDFQVENEGASGVPTKCTIYFCHPTTYQAHGLREQCEHASRQPIREKADSALREKAGEAQPGVRGTESTTHVVGEKK